MRGLGFFVGSILAIGDNRSSDDAQLIVHDQGMFQYLLHRHFFHKTVT